MPVLALVIERNEGGRRRRELLVPSHDLAIAMCCGEGQTSLSVRRVDPERGALAGRIIGDVQCSELFIGSAAEFACAIDAVRAPHPTRSCVVADRWRSGANAAQDDEIAPAPGERPAHAAEVQGHVL